jgi:phosphate starvation-inducible PhoH-like protein
LDEAKHDAFPNENVPNRMGKSANLWLLETLDRLIYRRTISGLKEALLILKDIEGIGIIYLDDKDIVRHRLVKSHR